MSKTFHAANRTVRGSTPNKSKYQTNVCTIYPPNPCERVLQERTVNLKRCNNGETGKTRDKNGARKPVGKVITKKDYEYLQERSRLLTKEERDAAIAKVESEKERLTRESMERKEAIRRMDLARSREKNARLSEIEAEARRRTMHILERAYNLKLEQEEEIQKCNRVILETKCRAIRDAQIAEKKLIERELAEEERRLNDMMENERRWAIKEDVKKEQEEASRKHEFAKMLKDQITENEEQRILEFERKQEESRLINLSNIAWQQEEISKLRGKEIENMKVREGLCEVNEQLKHFKAMEEQENKIIDQRIKEYQKKKDERDAKLAEEQKLEKMRKEKERDRIAAQASHAQELQAQIDEINVARVQEEVEREWRRKEKEAAAKRAEAQKALQAEREQQINTKRILQAIEIERDRREFERVLRVQKEAFHREKKEREKKQYQALVHRSEILKQVNEKERERIRSRQKMFEEGVAIRTEAAIRTKKLREAMERKSQEMRENKVPEMYINEVKRMIENIK